MVRRTATLALGALLLAGCSHSSPTPALDPATVLVNHYPACAGHIEPTGSDVECTLPGHYLIAMTAGKDKAQGAGDTLAQLYTTPTIRAWVDAIDYQGGQAVVIVRADG